MLLANSLVRNSPTNNKSKICSKRRRIIIIIAIILSMIIISFFVIKIFMAKVFLNKYEYNAYESIKLFNEYFDLNVKPKMMFSGHPKNKENITHYTIIASLGSEELYMNITIDEEGCAYSIGIDSDYYYKKIDDKIDNRDNLTNEFGIFGKFVINEKPYWIGLHKDKPNVEAYNNNYNILSQSNDYIVIECSSSKISFFL